MSYFASSEDRFSNMIALDHIFIYKYIMSSISCLQTQHFTRRFSSCFFNTLLTMTFAPNSLVRQKEGAQGEDEEEVGDRRKEGKTGIPTPDADPPTGPSRLRMSDARNKRKHGRWCGVLIYRRGIGG